MDTAGSDALVGNEGLDFPKFVVFNSLKNKNYLRPGGVHSYMKFETLDALRWGVKHEVQKAKYGDGLVHIKCCDTGKYWTWGLTEDSKHFIVAQADQPGEDETTSPCTLIKLSHTTKGDVQVFSLQVKHNGEWWPVGVNDAGYLSRYRFLSNEVHDLEDLIISNWESLQANQLHESFVGAENMDTAGSDASVGKEGLDLPKFVAFNSLSEKNYLRAEGEEGYIRFRAKEAISWGVKHEIQKANSGDGLVHIRCCDNGNYWTYDHDHYRVCAVVDQPNEDTNSSTCTLIKPSQYTKDGVSVLNFQARYRGIWWSVGGDSTGYLRTGGEDFIITNFASLQPVAEEEIVLPKFVLFNSFSNRKYLRPGGLHRYMKVEAVNAVSWGVKHEVQKAKYGRGLVHIRCCDTGKYWTWGLTVDSKDFITAQADQPEEDETRRACTLIKPSYNTKGDVKVTNLQVMYEDKWQPVGVNNGGCLVKKKEHDFLISDWKSQQANQPQGPFVTAENMDTAGCDASVENQGLDLPKFVAINSLMNKKYLASYQKNSTVYISFVAENFKAWGVKHEIQKAKCGGELVHIKCCDIGKYWGWEAGYNIIPQATQPEEDNNKRTCTLIKPSQYTKDGVTFVNLQIMRRGTWWSIGVDDDGNLAAGGEDFIISNWEMLQMGFALGPLGACVADSVTLKLCPTNYFTWKKLMLNFLATQDLSGFVDGTIKSPNKPHPAWEEANRAYTEWKRKDGLVRGWILATLTQNNLRQVMDLVTAREVWMELRKTFTSNFQLSHLELIGQKRGRMLSQYTELHKAALTANWETAKKFLETNPNAVSQPITSSLETALIMAVRSPKRNEFVKKLIEKMVNSPFTEEETERMVQEEGARLALKDISGATALHAAADGGNIEAAKWLVEKNSGLADIGDKYGTLPVHVAAGLGNREMVHFLLERTTNLSHNESGLKLLHLLASSGLYDVASTFLEKYPNLAGMEPSPLVVIAQKPTSFHSGTSLDIMHRLIYSGIPLKLEDIASNAQERETEDNPRGNDIENPLKCAISALCYAKPPPPNIEQRLPLPPDSPSRSQATRPTTTGSPTPPPLTAPHAATFPSTTTATPPPSCSYFAVSRVKKKGNALFWDVAEKLESILIPFNCHPIKSTRETKIIHYQALNLVKCLCKELVKIDPTYAIEIFTEPLRNATCMGIHEIVEEILRSDPSAMHFWSEENQSIFHLAVMYRHENVFNLIYQMEEDWRVLLSMPDASKNNALHLAGNLGLQQQLILRASAAGAALQMQRELQWFKAVEKLILPQAKERKNKEGKTPQELFSETHKCLVEEGEKWMKDTANSCSIVAALITTIVFAAAITVPGNTNGNSGLPIKLGYQAFTLFLVSDALAMFSSTTSLLMFLSILTSRYGEQDFLYSLPRRLIIGLATLFLSIISMMVAFGASLKITSGKTKAWIIICVAILSSVPITLFALLQFPLLLDMFKSTYYPSIKKQSNRILH